jgi:hexosaminidase
LAIGSLIAPLAGAGLAGQQAYEIVPRPAALAPIEGAFTLDDRVRAVLSDPGHAELRAAAESWLAAVRASTGLRLPIAEDVEPGSPRTISFVLDDAIAETGAEVAAEPGAEVDPEPGVAVNAEAYRLRVDPTAVVLSAATPAGIFYATQTLRQLLPVEVEGGLAGDGLVDGWSIPAVEIADAPRFRYRGMHLDVGRHMFPVEFIKKYLDLLALYKLNTFHWHLTEDQGWRIEIEKYPRLTEIGAYRRETILEKNFEPFVGDGVPYGGFYTQEEIRDVVAYAAERHITVIPEIEMPGHSLAALAAYPELACTEGPFEVGTRWGVYDDVYCPSEATFAFLEDVLTEVLELFPSRYIHIGGDEAPKVRWEESPIAQAVLAREGLASEEELQSYFIRRIERFLLEHGRRLIGWDEILEGGLAPQATVMSWRGTAGGIEAARQGHDVIMTPSSHVYFDYYQSRDRSQEPLAIGGFTPLEKVYAFEPVSAELTREEAGHVLGAQANVWTEYMKTSEHVEYMVFPRLLALAEVVWSPRTSRSWPHFLGRLPAHLSRLDALGVNYRIPDVRGLEGDGLLLADRVSLTLDAPVAAGEIRYTTDGSEPTRVSTRYAGPIELSLSEDGVPVRARVFLPDGRAGPMATARFTRARLRDPAVVVEDRLVSGLRFELYEGEFDSVQDLDGRVAGARGPAGGVRLTGREPRESGFGLRFTGYLRIPQDGIYSFRLTSDDGSRLSVAGEVTVDHDGRHAATERSGAVALRAGLHQVEARYFDAGGRRVLELEVSGAGEGWRPIPSEWLFHTP